MQRALPLKHPHTGRFREILRRMSENAGSFIRKNAVMCIAAVLAAVTAIAIPPDAKYAEYFDFKTLSCLFCTLAVVSALKNISFFYILAEQVVKLFKNTRACVLALVYITFIGSMLIANDMALLTFLPLGYFVLKDCGSIKTVAVCFVLQNIAANLGGMLTPFGNPQNLYLYTKFNIPNLPFMSTMLPSFILSVTLITLCCFAFIRKEPLEIRSEKKKLDPKRSVLYGVLFILSVLMVFRIMPFYAGLAIITVILLIADRRAIASVDYGLLFTFFFFFIFAGNMARLEGVNSILRALLDKNALLFSTLSCQFISNVPSAILLSGFTNSWQPLLIGVNIGGVGTLISSLASLITFREFTGRFKGHTKLYFAVFSSLSFAFLIILLLFNLAVAYL